MENFLPTQHSTDPLFWLKNKPVRRCQNFASIPRGFSIFINMRFHYG